MLAARYVVLIVMVLLLLMNTINRLNQFEGLPPAVEMERPPIVQKTTEWPVAFGIPAANVTALQTKPPLVTMKWATDGPIVPVLGISVFVNADLLIRLLNSIDYHVEKLVLIQNGRHPGVGQLFRRLRKEHPEWIIEAHPENVGCAGAWNRVIEAVPEAPWHIISNDDIAFHPGALKQFALGVERHVAQVKAGQSNKVILYPSHGDLMWGSPPWSCFAILQHAVKTIGLFDPNFWPVYHEDYDYMVRMARAGLWQTLIPQAKVQHGWSKGRYEPGMERASKDQGKLAVLDEYKAQQARHERGSPYYALKWGIGEVPGIYDAGNGYWNKTCNASGCTAQPHILYAHPFNDSSLPLSFWRFDPELRQCLQYGDRPKCRYNHRLLPNPHLVPHDIYKTVALRWARRIRRDGLEGDWLAGGAIKALEEADAHSVCYVTGCHVLGPEASIDEDEGTFFVFPGTEGFITYKLAKCMRLSRMSYHSSVPCDAADARNFTLSGAMAQTGPWAELLRWDANCTGHWVESPAFNLSKARYLLLRVRGNNGYAPGTRIAEVNFFASERPCKAT